LRLHRLTRAEEGPARSTTFSVPCRPEAMVTPPSVIRPMVTARRWALLPGAMT
jgi:hypothetical protein